MIEYDQGIHLKETDIWLDSKKSVRFSFISNAGFNTFSSHEKIIATPNTIKLLGKDIRDSIVLACPFNHHFALGRVQLEIIPAGYILGSSQIVIEIDGKRILYTGDFKLRGSLTAEPAEVRRSDVLIMKCVYGLAQYVFPETERVIDSITGFVDESLSAGITPVLLVDPLGKAEDIVKALGDIGYKLSLHKTIYRTVKMYEELGVRFSGYERFKPAELEGKVLLVPPHLRGARAIDEIPRKRIAVVAGWAINKEFAKSAFSADEGFPLSNHADYNELLELVEITKPKIVYLVHGFCAEFARTLQKRGFNAKPLETPSQLKLL